MAERIKIAVAALIAVGAFVAFYWLSDKPTVVRLAALLVLLAGAVAVMWFTNMGQVFLAFARESWEEAKRVVWPSRKETLQTTGAVFVFVFVAALFLWLVDGALLYVTQKLLGSGG